MNDILTFMYWDESSLLRLRSPSILESNEQMTIKVLRTSRKPPTGEELRKIKDAADLYMSNSFKLKVRPKYITKLAMGLIGHMPIH